ncbi:Transient receptor potential cation channel subfamily A member 1 [Eumeta japonica]|uniref:Transient receptor potential cation channel subfamily A member 1 n=1 Tax=Eumeta variegata TaxID=151549 RepID=A0A4C1ZZI1_EUMVA|nr:Transient receptor potential cation channel subfamily A member 1 [Eumeta japonica]
MISSAVLLSPQYLVFGLKVNLDLVLESNEDYITSELDKQKRRLREMSALLEQQHTLTRLIVQKMEIKTEADDVDEGVQPADTRFTPRWSSPRIRKKLRTAQSFNKSDAATVYERSPIAAGLSVLVHLHMDDVRNETLFLSHFTRPPIRP